MSDRDNHMNNELKPCPCPFCGSKVEIHGGPEEWTPSFNDPDSGGRPYYIDCKCGVHFEIGYCEYTEMVVAWNRRPTPHKYTLEELGEMDGQPVYILFGTGAHGWAIPEWETDEKVYLNAKEPRGWDMEPNTVYYDLTCHAGYDYFGLHILGWVAYDRPPEEEDDV